MGSVAVDVSDTGVGIPRADLEKIFEPFYTTRAASGGTGLGLGLCRMLIAEMGGRMEVRSALGHGTTFTVVLNRAETRRRRPPRPGRQVPSPAHAGACSDSAVLGKLNT